MLEGQLLWSFLALLGWSATAQSVGSIARAGWGHEIYRTKSLPCAVGGMKHGADQDPKAGNNTQKADGEGDQTANDEETDKQDENTIQQELVREARRLLGFRILVHAWSRLDSGRFEEYSAAQLGSRFSAPASRYRKYYLYSLFFLFFYARIFNGESRGALISLPSPAARSLGERIGGM